MKNVWIIFALLFALSAQAFVCKAGERLSGTFYLAENGRVWQLSFQRDLTYTLRSPRGAEASGRYNATEREVALFDAYAIGGARRHFRFYQSGASLTFESTRNDEVTASEVLNRMPPARMGTATFYTRADGLPPPVVIQPPVVYPPIQPPVVVYPPTQPYPPQPPVYPQPPVVYPPVVVQPPGDGNWQIRHRARELRLEADTFKRQADESLRVGDYVGYQFNMRKWGEKSSEADRLEQQLRPTGGKFEYLRLAQERKDAASTYRRYAEDARRVGNWSEYRRYNSLMETEELKAREYERLAAQYP